MHSLTCSRAKSERSLNRKHPHLPQSMPSELVRRFWIIWTGACNHASDAQCLRRSRLDGCTFLWLSRIDVSLLLRHSDTVPGSRAGCVVTHPSTWAIWRLLMCWENDAICNQDSRYMLALVRQDLISALQNNCKRFAPLHFHAVHNMHSQAADARARAPAPWSQHFAAAPAHATMHFDFNVVVFESEATWARLELADESPPPAQAGASETTLA